MVKEFTSRTTDPGFRSRFLRGDFSGWSHTCDLKCGTPAAILSGTSGNRTPDLPLSRRWQFNPRRSAQDNDAPSTLTIQPPTLTRTHTLRLVEGLESGRSHFVHRKYWCPWPSIRQTAMALTNDASRLSASRVCHTVLHLLGAERAVTKDHHQSS